ncbi:MAG: F0F1 ATP synthase subunit epsilon [Acidobacteria bacterium]|jgi:F-type H+-transporting ATPase subunit epsilon|nr:F0F1 ATP synthase subunit epsilon [Acidobacteriota bacterium]
MPQASLMNLKVLLPFKIFIAKTGISRIVVETSSGSYGFLPQRLDCTAALTPGILIYENKTEGEAYIAIDEGILVKTGLEMTISVRNAISGKNLGQLREAVEQEFLNLDEREKNVRTVLAKIESDFISHLIELKKK